MNYLNSSIELRALIRKMKMEADKSKDVIDETPKTVNKTKPKEKKKAVTEIHCIDSDNGVLEVSSK